jgi:hypothetical protein
VTHHPPKRRACDQFKTDKRRHRVAGKAKHWSAVEQPERERLRRFDGDLHPTHVGDARQHRFHDIEVAHTHTTAGDDGVESPGSVTQDVGERGFVVANNAEVNDLATGLSDEPGDHTRVAFADLARFKGAVVAYQLISGGKHGDLCPANHRDPIPADRRQHTDVGWTEMRSAGQHKRAGTNITPGPANRVTRLDRAGELHEVVGDGAVFDHHNCVGTWRNGCARHNAHGFTRADRSIGSRSGCHRADDPKRGSRRDAVGEAHRVGGLNGKTIDRRVVEWRHILGGSHIVSNDEPERIFKTHLDRGQTTASSKHVVAGLVEWGHTRDGSGLPTAWHTATMRENLAIGSWLSSDGGVREEVTVAFENEGFTVEGRLHGPEISYAARFDAMWSIRQFLLFRDLEEPDLWLAVDKFGKWGEVNGSIRADMAGCNALSLSSLLTPHASAYLYSPTLRRLTAHGLMSDRIRSASINVDTLEIAVADDTTVERLPTGGWLVGQTEIELDGSGLVGDVPSSFTRIV